jgi:bifunctional non-homologous end joining protein LigD
LLDGEVVVLNEEGLSDFQRLQNSIKQADTNHLVYFVFDLPYLNGFDLTQVPLRERKEQLSALLLGQDPTNAGSIRYGGHIQGQGPLVAQEACRTAAEGIVSKRIESHYHQRRTSDWLKIKCSHRQEFVIGGYTAPGETRAGFGALLLGYYQGQKLIYCGRVGTGFTHISLKQLAEKLKILDRRSSPFESPVPRTGDSITWVRPELVCEVQFTGWSDDGMLRHPSFQGLREDKKATEVKREIAVAGNAKKPSHKNIMPGTKLASAKTSAAKPSRGRRVADLRLAETTVRDDVAGVQLTHPDRVLYPAEKITKYDLARYCEELADWVLPQLVYRPLTLMRCPAGQGQTCFYQKHLAESMPEHVESVMIQEKDSESAYVYIKDLAGLISLVQMGVLELHPWPARIDRLEAPDRMIFDLDPGEGADWSLVLQGANDLRTLMDALKLKSFVRTSGGKGLHIMVPLSRRNSWDELKEFSQAIANLLAKGRPDNYLATMSKAKRRGKVFIDYLRNQRGATAVASYSTRARAGAPVATPIAWKELTADLRPDQFNIFNVRERLKRLKKDPWQGFSNVRQSITQALWQKLDTWQ